MSPPTQPHETPRRGGVLREGYDYDFSRTDPTGAHVDPAWCAIYETVAVSGPDGELGPMVAESWRQDPERENVWRFRIRPGLTFQSGAPCDAGGGGGCAAPARRPGRGADQRVLLAQRRRRERRGRRGAGRAARAERRHAAAAALVALGDPQPGRAPGGGRRLRPHDRRRHGAVRVRRVGVRLAPRRRPLGGLVAAPAPTGSRTARARRISTACAGSRSSTTASAPRRSSAARSTASRTPRCSTSTGSGRTPTSR